MKFKKFLFGGAVVAASVVATSLITTQPAYAAGGNVFNGNRRPIVGMWVEVQGGRSGWAELHGSGSNRTWYYDT